MRGGVMAALMAAFGSGVAMRPPPLAEALLRGPVTYRPGRGKGRGTPSRNYGNRSSHSPSQGAQERIRRALDGFAAPRGNPGFTKNGLLDAIQRGHVVTFNDARDFKYVGK